MNKFQEREIYEPVFPATTEIRNVKPRCTWAITDTQYKIQRNAFSMK